MSENEIVEPVEAAAEKPAKKKAKDQAKNKSKAKAKVLRGKAEKSASPDKAAKPADNFDFVGKVETLRVRSGGGAESFEFGLKGRHGKRKHFRFDAADAFAMNAMAHLVLTAHASDARIGVRTGAEVAGVLVVRELESRPGLGKKH